MPRRCGRNWFRAVGDARPFVWGHAALEYALSYPGSLSHLVLLDTGGDSRWPQQNAADLLARRGYSLRKAELVRRWFNGEFAPTEYYPIFMRIGDAYCYGSGWPLLARHTIHGGWHAKMRPEACRRKLNTDQGAATEF
jgi:proline iminopeptidase